MKVVESKLRGCFMVEPAVFGDERGFFFETWNAERFAQHPDGRIERPASADTPASAA